MLEAAAAWDDIGSELRLAADAFGSVTADLAGPPDGAASVDTSTGFHKERGSRSKHRRIRPGHRIYVVN